MRSADAASLYQGTDMSRDDIEELYRVFSWYRGPGPASVLGYKGINRSLRELTYSDWCSLIYGEPYSIAFYEADIFKYFLPRGLEIIDSQRRLKISPDQFEIEAGMRNHNWLQWPVKEVEALRNLFDRWVKEGAEFEEEEYAISLFFLWEIESDLSRYLQPYLHSHPLKIARWLNEMSWNPLRENVREWALRPDVILCLEDAFYHTDDEEESADLVEAIDNLRWAMEARDTE